MPPPGAPGTAPPPGVPATAPAAAYGVPDPHGLGVAASRLSGGSRKNGRAALAVLSLALQDGDVVEQVLVGQYHGVEGAAAVLATDLVLVNAREWQPEVVRVALAGMGVQGMADGRKANLTFTSGATQDTFAGVSDTDLAVEFANRIRQKAAGA